MATDAVFVLPDAKTFAEKVALREAEEVSRRLQQQHEAEAARHALIEHYRQPSGVSDEEAIRRALLIIERATANGLTEVQVYRFPNELCTDRGRAINQGEAGWQTTLTGIPREIYQLWDRYFRPKGYHLKAEIVDFPNGMPGDVGMTLSWG